MESGKRAVLGLILAGMPVAEQGAMAENSGETAIQKDVRVCDDAKETTEIEMENLLDNLVDRIEVVYGRPPNCTGSCVEVLYLSDVEACAEENPKDDLAFGQCLSGKRQKVEGRTIYLPWGSNEEASKEVLKSCRGAFDAALGKKKVLERASGRLGKIEKARSLPVKPRSKGKSS